jgi:hypothetical protein
MKFALGALLLAAPASAKIYFKDTFDNKDAWTTSVFTG